MLLCLYLLFTLSGLISQGKVKLKTIGKQGLKTDLTHCLLMYYSVLYEQFCGNFMWHFQYFYAT